MRVMARHEVALTAISAITMLHVVATELTRRRLHVMRDQWPTTRLAFRMCECRRANVFVDDHGPLSPQPQSD